MSAEEKARKHAWVHPARVGNVRNLIAGRDHAYDKDKLDSFLAGHSQGRLDGIAEVLEMIRGNNWLEIAGKSSICADISTSVLADWIENRVSVK